MNQLIISESLFKNYSPITQNVCVDDFFPYALVQQQLYIEPVLGTELVDELLFQIQENNLSELNKQLLIRIAPALSYYIVYHGLGFHLFKVVEKGVTAAESDNSKSAGLKDVEALRTQCLTTAETFLQRLQEFLTANSVFYPKWVQTTVQATPEQGIYFPSQTWSTWTIN